MPSLRATCIAAGRDESGIGMTTSILSFGVYFAIVSARRSPMRSRASYTEMPFMIESGRARYTYSKEHGTSFGSFAHCFVCRLPSRSMNTASPGSTSRTTSNPPFSSTRDSEATIHS